MSRRTVPLPGTSKRQGFSDNTGLGIATSSLIERTLSTGDEGTRDLSSGLGTSTSLLPSTSSAIGILSIRSPLSSSTAHRGPYSKPPFLNQTRTSRFSPYSRKPIFVSAKKQDDDEIEPHLTSTAQRMIEILQKNSTPVFDGRKKVGIHNPIIKSLKPNLTTVRVDKQGPPTTRLPLTMHDIPYALPAPPKFLMPPVPLKSPSSKPTNTNINIPPTKAKTSPFAPIPSTSSPSALSFDYDSQKSMGGGKMKGKSSRVHEPPRRSAVPPKDSFTTPIAPSNSATSAPRRRFKFGKAWSAAEMSPGRQSLPNGTVDERDDFWNKLFGAVKQENGPKTLFSLINGGDREKLTLPASVTSEALSIFGGDSSREKGADKAASSFPPPIQSLALSASKQKEWECPSCMVFNLLSKEECACCATPRPARFASTENKDTASGAAIVKGATSTWPCPTCLISNQVSDAACVCCTEPRPPEYSSEVKASPKSEPTKSTPSFSFGFKGPPTTPTSALDLPKSKTTPDESSAEKFKFGLTAITTSASASSSTKITEPAKTASNFTFGIPFSSPSSTTPTPTPLPSAAAFRFGFGLTTPASTSPSFSVFAPTTTAPVTADISKPIPSLTTWSQANDEIDKFKFKPFAGGPKPSYSNSPKPNPQITFDTPTVSASAAPISFGSNASTLSPPATSTPPKPTPFIFGGTTSAATSMTTAVTAPPLPTPATLLGIKPATATSTLSSSSTAPPTSTPFSFGLATSSSGGFSAAIPKTSTVTGTPSTATMPAFSFGMSTTTAATEGNPLISPGGGGEAQKRKFPSEASPAGGGFFFNPSERQPKLKRGEGATTPSPVVMKGGSFLDAMKQPGFGSVDKPDGRLPPLNAAGGFSFTNPNAGLQFPVTSPPAPTPSPLFTFGASNPNPQGTLPPSNNVFNFGSSQPAAAVPQSNAAFSPSLVPNFTFGQNTPGGAPLLFSAGASSTPGGDGTGRRPTKRAVRRLR